MFDISEKKRHNLLPNIVRIKCVYGWCELEAGCVCVGPSVEAAAGTHTVTVVCVARTWSQ